MSEAFNGQPNGNGRKVRFDFTFGPAFVAIILNMLAGLAIGSYVAGQMATTAENTRATTDRLTQIIDRTNQRADGINDRLIKVETLLDGVSHAVAAINDKIDRGQARRP